MILLLYYSFCIEKHYKITATMDAPQGQHAHEMVQLVRQIVNFPEGSPCFLCQTTEGRECIWDEIGDELTMEGRNTIIWHEASEGHFMRHPPIEESHCAARYACYRRYIYTASSWTPGSGRIRVPTCVENNIRRLFPGDGVFVGFNDGVAGNANAAAVGGAARNENGAAV